MKKKRILLIIVFCLIAIAATIVLFNFNSKSKNNIEFPISHNEADIIVGENSSSNTIFVFFNYNCKYCQRFLNDFKLFSNDSTLKDLDVKIILKPLAMSQSQSEYHALQTLIGLYLYGNPSKVHDLFLHNYNIIYRKEFFGLTDVFINDNPSFAEFLLNNEDYIYLKTNLLQFNMNKLDVTPTFIINNRKFKGYKNKKSFLKRLIKELNKNTSYYEQKTNH
ncbi:DsbA family protein [Carboxylicivirga sp. N1Y90]|uniref:DsbA family protein n=1 Tax=Carboxylicivirga fragile TaxID=3417571 RepID=UPI003D337AB5|nr:thioredoxin domain-containing protein [Marinilabiliaceae bacterium N1Y90]